MTDVDLARLLDVGGLNVFGVFLFEAQLWRAGGQELGGVFFCGEFAGVAAVLFLKPEFVDEAGFAGDEGDGDLGAGGGGVGAVDGEFAVAQLARFYDMAWEVGDFIVGTHLHSGALVYRGVTYFWTAR